MPWVEKVPLWHNVHARLLLVFAMEPAGHGKHSEALPGKYVPGWQTMQARAMMEYHEPVPHGSGACEGGVVLPPLKMSSEANTTTSFVLGITSIVSSERRWENVDT